jgi:Zn/Cd-binding protein ZinT
MMMGRKQTLKGGDEYDLVGSWRRWYCYLQRAGVAKSIKKKMNKRARKDAKRKMYTREDT